MQYYTERTNNFHVEGSTVLEAVRAAVLRFPALSSHVFDQNGNLRRHIGLFVNDISIAELAGKETATEDSDVIRILPAISGG
jgi:molybdopterin converting factor small subunit